MGQNKLLMPRIKAQSQGLRMSLLAMSCCVFFASSAWSQMAAALSTAAPTGAAPAAVSASPAAAPVVPVAPVIETLNLKSDPLGASGRMGSVLTSSGSKSEAGARELPPLANTEFQNFVAENSGQKLPLFGYDLFSGARFDSLQNVPVPSDYAIGPGDEVLLKTWGSVDADLRLPVDRYGQINVPRIGVIKVAGLKVSQLEPTLRANIGRVYKNFQLSANLGELRTILIYVVGNARKPGAYNVSSLSTLISALFESGGPSATGSMRNIQLKRDGATLSSIDIYKFISEGNKTADLRLQNGDVIVIPPAGQRVALMGVLDQPAIYELAAGDTLGKVIAYSGRQSAIANPRMVQIERVDPARPKNPRVVENRALDAAGMQLPMRDSDMITLFRVNPEFANAVTLRGAVASPLRYAHKTGMKITDLIPEREALVVPDYYFRKNLLVQNTGVKSGDTVSALDSKNRVEEINWEYALVERLDVQNVRNQLLPFNLARALSDPSSPDNMSLLPGDVVTIFSAKDIPVPIDRRNRYVRVSGEVNTPGLYLVASGETLDQLVRRAGGFTTNAYPYGAVFTRESTRVQQQSNLDRAVRLMEAEIGSGNNAQLQNAAAQQKGDLVQVQLAAQRSQIEKLRSLKASGRIALDAEPQGKVLANISLEDGDAIQIPPIPSFVGVFGAVLAETSFLHKQAQTVRQYVKQAGLLRSADEDNIVIVRADGSVLSNASNSWFSSNSVMSAQLYPGDSIFVPEIMDRRTPYVRFIEGAKDWTGILYQFGIGAAAWKTLKN